MAIRPTKLFIFLYLAVSFLLLFYSFTQIDLGFNLPNIPLWVSLQKSMQHIGYFNRPLSTILYLILLLLLFGYYIFFIFITKKKLLDVRTFWILLFAVSIFLTASYNAFSYDLFNYIFDAKILSFYHLNPYGYKALDFPTDPMLGFMHWTHRTYPYGPVWLILTAPLYFLGFSNFLPTQILFKLLIGGSFLGTVYFIGKILGKINPKSALFGMVLFGFNPLVLVESLVSSHNDIVMMFFAIASVYCLIEKKNLSSFALLLISIGTKFATALLLPLYLYHWYQQKQKKEISWDTFFLCSLLLMGIGLVLVSLRTTFQPWYLLYVLPFAALLAGRPSIIISGFILSLAALLNYVPFLFLGNWDAPVPSILLAINVSAVVLSLAISLYWQKRSTKVRHSV